MPICPIFLHLTPSVYTELETALGLEWIALQYLGMSITFPPFRPCCVPGCSKDGIPDVVQRKPFLSNL